MSRKNMLEHRHLCITASEATTSLFSKQERLLTDAEKMENENKNVCVVYSDQNKKSEFNMEPEPVAVQLSLAKKLEMGETASLTLS